MSVVWTVWDRGLGQKSEIGFHKFPLRVWPTQTVVDVSQSKPEKTEIGIGDYVACLRWNLYTFCTEILSYWRHTSYICTEQLFPRLLNKLTINKINSPIYN